LELEVVVTLLPVVTYFWNSSLNLMMNEKTREKRPTLDEAAGKGEKKKGLIWFWPVLPFGITGILTKNSTNVYSKKVCF